MIGKNKKDTQNHIVHFWRKHRAKIFFGLLLSAILIVDIMFIQWMFQKEENAKAVYDTWVIIIPSLVGLVVGIYKFKKTKLYTFLSLIALAVILILNIFLASIAKEHSAETTPDISTHGINVESEQGQPEKSKEFIWHDDIYIISLEKYCKAKSDKEAIIFLIKNYAEHYLKDDSNLEVKSHEELNGGAYGNYINDAMLFESIIEKAITSEAKEIALLSAVQCRELANNEHKAYDNLKELGDLYIKKTKIIHMKTTIHVETLEQALRYYIEALPLAYWAGASEDYIKEIWKAIKNTYLDLGKNEEVLDSGHQDRILVISEICNLWCND